MFVHIYTYTYVGAYREQIFCLDCGECDATHSYIITHILNPLFKYYILSCKAHKRCFVRVFNKIGGATQPVPRDAPQSSVTASTI